MPKAAPKLTVLPKVVSPLEFARTNRKRRMSTCECCENREAKKAVEIVVAERLAGRSQATAQGLFEYLRENCGIRVEVNAVRRHLRQHTKWYEAAGAS